MVQRGFVSTLPSSVNIAADRAPVSDIDAKLSGEANVFEGVCDAAYPVSMLMPSAATETRI